MKTHLIFVKRQSPSWKSLAQAYRAGQSIDPHYYMPPVDVLGFPKEVPYFIAKWNKQFSIDYFSCRAIIQEIAERNNQKAVGVRHVTYLDYDLIEESLPLSMVFFHDDDDLFDPSIAEKIGDLDMKGADVLVSPLFRFHSDLFTFVRGGEQCELVLGRRQDFGFRYQTNNYGICGTSLNRYRFAAMKDHVEASAFADKAGLTDRITCRPLSATIKTIWSASMLSIVNQGKTAVIKELQGFRARTQQICLPKEYNWLGESLDKFCVLMRFMEEDRDFELLNSRLFTN